MASTSDKITDVRNGSRPNSARVSTPRSIGGTNLACNDLTGWPTASKVHFVTYQIDTNSNPIDTTQQDCYGIVSGNTITNLTVVDGTDSGNSVGDVVEMLPTAAWGQDLADALTTTLNRDGTLRTGIVTTAKIADSAVTTDKIAASNVTTEKINDSAVTAAKLASTAVTNGKIDWSTFSNNIKFATNPSTITAGSSTSPQNLSGNGCSISFTNTGTAYAYVTVSVAVYTSSDFEFYVGVMLNGTNQTSFTPNAAPGGGGASRSVERSSSFLVTLPAGTNTLAPSMTVFNGSGSYGIAAGGVTIAAIVFGNVTA